MPVPKGPTSKVGLELSHWAGLLVASSCRVVVGVGVGIVAVRSVVVVGTHLDLGLCSCFIKIHLPCVLLVHPCLVFYFATQDS